MKPRIKKALRIALLVAVPVLIYQSLLFVRYQVPLKVSHKAGYNTVMALSPNGDTVCSGGEDKQIHFWSYGSKQELFSLVQGASAICLSFSPSGRYLACGSYHRFTVWDVVTKKLIGKSTGNVEVWDAEFSPDERTLVISGVVNSSIGAVELWQLQPLKKVRDLPRQENVVFSVGIAPDGLLASGNWHGPANLWDLQKGAQKVNLASSSAGQSNMRVAFSPNGKLLAMGGGKVTVWDVQTRKVLRTFPYKWNVRSLAFSSDGHYLAIGGDYRDTPVTVWDVNSGYLKMSIQSHDAGITQVKFWPDDSRLAVVTDDTLQLWRM